MYLSMTSSVLTNATTGVYFISGFVIQIERVLENGPSVNVYTISPYSGGAAGDQPVALSTDAAHRRSLKAQQDHSARLVRGQGQRAILQAPSNDTNVMVIFSLVYQNLMFNSSNEAKVYADIMT